MCGPDGDGADSRSPALVRMGRSALGGSCGVGVYLMPRVVPAAEVGAYLARHRPPAHRYVDMRVPPHEPAGPASHESVLTAVLSEVMTMWPSGTVIVVDYPGDGYAQALAYPPSILTEVGPAESVPFREAVALGWMDPGATPPGHPDFASQPVWIDNPVREWDYPVDTLPEIAAFLSRSVRELFGHDPGDGYVVHIWNETDHGDEDDPPEPDPVGDVIEDLMLSRA